MKNHIPTLVVRPIPRVKPYIKFLPSPARQKVNMRKFTHIQRLSAVPVPVPATADKALAPCVKLWYDDKNKRQGRNASAFVAF